LLSRDPEDSKHAAGDPYWAERDGCCRRIGSLDVVEVDPVLDRRNWLLR